VYLGALPAAQEPPPAFKVTEDGDRIRIAGAALDASVRKKGYVSGSRAVAYST
jgi:hypothetical protein